MKKNCGFAGLLNGKGASLISIEEYAAKEGVSVELVEASSKAGIVQIRRHKGKTFIVDQPLTPYSQRRDRAAVSALQQVQSRPEQSRGATKQDMPAGSITKLAWKMFRNSRQSTGKALKPAELVCDKK